MRSRNLIIGAAVVALWVIFLLRQHIHELIEVVRTYGTFHSMVRTHQELMYRYPEQTSDNETVPHILHNIALGGADVSKYDAAISSCRELHPDWEYMVWGDENGTAFIAEHYPEILPHYTQYPQNIQRANVLRYALLHTYGGVYLDLDVTCHVALDSTPIVHLSYVSPGAFPAAVNNAFIATHAGHPFLRQILTSVPAHDLYWGLPMRIPYVENMLSTGCMYYSNEWMVYARALLEGRQTELVHVLADEQGQMEPHMLRGKVTTPLFSHGGASSWHSWDAGILLMISHHWTLFLFFLFFSVASLIGLPIILRTSAGRKAFFRLHRSILNLVRSGFGSNGKVKTEGSDPAGRWA